jgi:hypothetical protein
MTKKFLTVKSEIIRDSGLIIFSIGDKVEVEEFVIQESFYGKWSGIWYPEEIIGVTLIDYPGVTWSLSIFEE